VFELNFKEFVKVRDYLYRKTGIYIDDKKQNAFVKKLQPYLNKNGYESFRSFFSLSDLESSSEISKFICAGIISSVGKLVFCIDSL